MSTDPTLILMQWLSPGFPVGAFAYSHGLETAIAAGDIRDIKKLDEWLRDLIAFGSGRADTILLAAAYRANPDEIAEIDETARAFAASAGRLLETDQQGAAFARTVTAVWGTDLGDVTYPVAVGCAARAQAIPLEQIARPYLHAFTANLISAAVRLVPLGQTEGQMLLAQLTPLIEQTAAEAIETPLHGLSSACFAADIAAMHHETLYSKVFRT